MNFKGFIRRLGLITIISGIISGIGALYVLVTGQCEDFINYFLVVGKILEPFAFLAIFLSLGDIDQRIHFTGFFLTIIGQCLLLDGLWYPTGPVILIIGILILATANHKKRGISVWIMWLYFIGLIITYGMESVQYPLFRHGIGTLIYSIALILLGRNVKNQSKKKEMQ